MIRRLSEADHGNYHEEACFGQLLFVFDFSQGAVFFCLVSWVRFGVPFYQLALGYLIFESEIHGYHSHPLDVYTQDYMFKLLDFHYINHTLRYCPIKE